MSQTKYCRGYNPLNFFLRYDCDKEFESKIFRLILDAIFINLTEEKSLRNLNCI